MNKITSLATSDFNMKQYINHLDLCFALGFILLIAILFALLSIYWRWRYYSIYNLNKPVVVLQSTLDNIQEIE